MRPVVLRWVDDWGVDRGLVWEGGGTMYRPNWMERRITLYTMVRVPLSTF